MAWNLYLLSVYFERQADLLQSRQMLVNVHGNLIKNPLYYSNWARLLLFFLDPPSEVVIMGPKARNVRKNLDAYFLPSVILAGSDKPGNLPLLKNRFVKSKNLIYVCKGNVCKIPVNSAEEAVIQIRHQTP